MAPREQQKTPQQKGQRTIIKTNTTRKGTQLLTTAKTMSTARKTDKTPLKANTPAVERQRTNTAPMPATPKPKEAKTAPVPPGSVTKSAKKSWKRRPKPAHSGVPVPEKMRKLLERQLADSDL